MPGTNSVTIRLVPRTMGGADEVALGYPGRCEEKRCVLRCCDGVVAMIASVSRPPVLVHTRSA